MKQQTTSYHCDNCGKTLPSSQNSVRIVTSKDEHSLRWSRLRVTILRHHGVNNNGELEPADLCQNCTEVLLRDAADRVRNGERASRGVESPDQEGFNI